MSELSGPVRWAAVGLRNLYWGRTHGWANLLQEHDLDLRTRIPRDLAKLTWRARHGEQGGAATPVLLFGAQRSGTNMVTYGLAMAPEFAVYNEGDRRAFTNYRLRSPDRIHELVTRSKHTHVLFKPLLDSHHADTWLDMPVWEGRSRGLWVYRDHGPRARSAVAKFGSSNLRVLLRRGEPGFTHWQLGEDVAMSPEVAELLDSFDPASLSPIDAAALFWYARNSLYFDLGLDQRPDVELVHYESFLQAPERVMRRMCEFLGFEYRDALVAHVATRPPAPGVDSDVSPAIRSACESLERRLSAAAV